MADVRSRPSLPLPTPTPTPTPTPNRKVRSRLFRTRWPWLLVFDNVSSARLVEQTGVLPRGCHGVGHVLVTSRQLSEASSSLSQLAACRAVVQVGCLRAELTLTIT